MTEACDAVWQLSFWGLPDNYIVHTNVHECVCPLEPGCRIQESGAFAQALLALNFVQVPDLHSTLNTPIIHGQSPYLMENIQDSHSPLLATTRSTLKR